MALRGIRGAVDLAADTRGEILSRTRELLLAMVKANRVRRDDIAAAFFTVTPDLNAEFPATAARDLSWTHVPMMCAREIPVRGAMKRVVRVMLLVNSNVSPRRVRHQYLGKTPCLRPDLSGAEGGKK